MDAALDAHEPPPEALRAAWKHVSRLAPAALDAAGAVDDPRAGAGFAPVGCIGAAQQAAAFAALGADAAAAADAPVLAHPLLPGLRVVPALLPPPVQAALLDRLLHRDLGAPEHATNLHLHYEPPAAAAAGSSLFALPPDAPAVFRPRDPAVHRPLSARQALSRRLHWLTLGGQYDWSRRVYPDRAPPPFPPDLAACLAALFPDTRPQAAIVNLYSPADTMMMHRDVSERSDRGLVSLSFGCDCLFMIAPAGAADAAADQDKTHLLLRLRSGDALYMADDARFAWHGVPKILQGTCPSHLERWPARDGRFAEWDGWMSNKRINLNVRQMWD